MKFDSSAFGVDLKRSNSYLTINNNNNTGVSRSWPHGVDGNKGGVDTTVLATSKRSCKMTEKREAVSVGNFG